MLHPLALSSRGNEQSRCRVPLFHSPLISPSFEYIEVTSQSYPAGVKGNHTPRNVQSDPLTAKGHHTVPPPLPPPDSTFLSLRLHRPKPSRPKSPRSSIGRGASVRAGPLGCKRPWWPRRSSAFCPSDIDETRSPSNCLTSHQPFLGEAAVPFLAVSTFWLGGFP